MLAASESMEPPIALLAYATGEPSKAAFWPFAVFSPEWQALQWAAKNGVQARFCDLPAFNVLADQGIRTVREGDPSVRTGRGRGFDDTERWWGFGDRIKLERRFFRCDHRGDGGACVRRCRSTRRQRIAEAYMRQVLRKTLKDGAERGMSKVKTSLTWVPWTHSRLASASGYGAGITSPGWYHHLSTANDKTITRWLTKVARVLRDEDLPISSAHVIEAVRLADTLAALRSRPLAGFVGSYRGYEVGDVRRKRRSSGSDSHEDSLWAKPWARCPEETPTGSARSRPCEHVRRLLRLKQQAGAKALDLDLRRDIDVASVPCSTPGLGILEIDWGTPADRYDGGRSGGIRVVSEDQRAGHHSRVTDPDYWRTHCSQEASRQLCLRFGECENSCGTRPTCTSDGGTDRADPNDCDTAMCAEPSRDFSVDRRRRQLVDRICTGLTQSPSPDWTIPAPRSFADHLDKVRTRQSWSVTIAMRAHATSTVYSSDGWCGYYKDSGSITETAAAQRFVSGPCPWGSARRPPEPGGSTGFSAVEGLCSFTIERCSTLIDTWSANFVSRTSSTRFPVASTHVPSLRGRSVERSVRRSEVDDASRRQWRPILDAGRAGNGGRCRDTGSAYERRRSSSLRRWRLMLGNPLEESTGRAGPTGRQSNGCSSRSALRLVPRPGAPPLSRIGGVGAVRRQMARRYPDVLYQHGGAGDARRTQSTDWVWRSCCRNRNCSMPSSPMYIWSGTLLSLNQVMPEASRRPLLEWSSGKVVSAEVERIAQKTKAAVTGALNRSARTSNRSYAGHRLGPNAIRANLSHYLPEYRTVVPERLVGYGRKSKSVQRDVVL
ncbi:unnamed protein product, partial [Mesorhabditis spiculigera]